MATLYIHIGTPKTGTTSIQNFLMENAEQLEQHRICFPYMDLNYPKKKYKFRRNAHFLVYKSDLQGAEGEREEKEIYRQGFEIIREKAQSAKKIIITDEAVWYRQNRKEKFWQEIKKDANAAGCEVKVVVYLRRQDLYVQSLWNQSIKYYPRITYSFQKYLKSEGLASHNLDYGRKLSEIAEVIGKDNLIVRVYEKEHLLSSESGIFSDFMNAVSEEMEDSYLIPEAAFNQNLSGNFIEIKRKMNESLSYKEMEDFLNEPLILASNIKKQKKESYFSYKEQLAYIQKFEKSNARVAREFLGREDGVLFSEPVEELPQWKVNPETMYEDIIRVYTEIAVAQQKQIEVLRERVACLERNQKPYGILAGRKVKSKLKEMIWKDKNN